MLLSHRPWRYIFYVNGVLVLVVGRVVHDPVTAVPTADRHVTCSFDKLFLQPMKLFLFAFSPADVVAVLVLGGSVPALSTSVRKC